MRRVILGGLFLATLNLLGASQALALASYDDSGTAQKVHLRGYMPVTRIIYVDQQDRILSVTGNTDENITPIVARPNSAGQLKLTSFIDQQYQRILQAQGGHLKAGVTYYPAAPAGTIRLSLTKLANG
ncbi:MAG TPA: hypothetical protein VFT49_00560 [Candidatus Saccharimonadales bacterium]|nr:hypothetical protein [Candidatus Saccharimonadales bacterium]